MKIVPILVVALTLATGLVRAASPALLRAEVEAQQEIVRDFLAHMQLKQYAEAVGAYEKLPGGRLTPDNIVLPGAVLAYERTGQSAKAIATLARIRESERVRLSNPKMAKMDAERPSFLYMLVRNLNQSLAKMSDPAVKSETEKLIRAFPPEKDLWALVRASHKTPPAR